MFDLFVVFCSSTPILFNRLNIQFQFCYRAEPIFFGFFFSICYHFISIECIAICMAEIETVFCGKSSCFSVVWPNLKRDSVGGRVVFR